MHLAASSGLKEAAPAPFNRNVCVPQLLAWPALDEISTFQSTWFFQSVVAGKTGFRILRPPLISLTPCVL